VCSMIIPAPAFEKFSTAIATVVGARYPDIFVDPELARAVVENREKILSHIPKKYAKSVRRILDWLNRNMKRIERITEDPGIADIVTRYVKWLLLRSESFDDIVREAQRVLIKYVPQPGEYNGRSVYVVSPSPTTLEKLSLTIDAGRVMDALQAIARRVVRFGDNSHVIVFGHVITAPRQHYLEVMYAFSPQEYRKYLQKLANEILAGIGELRAYVVGVDVHRNSIVFTLKPEVVSEIARQKQLPVPEDYSSHISEVRLSLNVLPDRQYAFLGFRAPRYANYIAKQSWTDIPDNLPHVLPSFLEKAFAEYIELLQLVAEAHRLAQQYGYKYKSVCDSERAKLILEKPALRIVLGKTTAIENVADVDISIEIAKPTGTDEATIEVTGTVTWKHEYVRVNLERLVAEHLARKGIDYKFLSPFTQKVIVMKSFSTRQPVKDLENAVNYAENLASALVEVVEELYRVIEDARSRKLSDAHYLALFLANYVTFESINIPFYTGRPLPTIVSAVKRILRKYANTSIDRPSEKPAIVLTTLIEHSLLDVDETGEVLVLDKPLRELLRELGIPEEVVDHVHKKVLLEWWNIVSPSTDMAQYLKQKGLLTPKFVSTLIKLGVRVPAGILLEPWQGKSIVDYLDADDKRAYIRAVAGWEDVKHILNNPALAIAFRDVSADVILRAEPMGPEMLMKSILIMAPDIIGVTAPALYREGGNVIGIDRGVYVVVPYALGKPHRQSYKWFLVLNKHDKLGIAVLARTVDEAVYQVIDWASVLEEIEQLKTILKDAGWHVEEADYHGFKYLKAYTPTSYMTLTELLKDAGIPHASLLVRPAPVDKLPRYRAEVVVFKGMAQTVTRILQQEEEKELLST